MQDFVHQQYCGVHPCERDVLGDSKMNQPDHWLTSRMAPGLMARNTPTDETVKILRLQRLGNNKNQDSQRLQTNFYCWWYSKWTFFHMLWHGQQAFKVFRSRTYLPSRVFLGKFQRSTLGRFKSLDFWSEMCWDSRIDQQQRPFRWDLYVSRVFGCLEESVRNAEKWWILCSPWMEQQKSVVDANLLFRYSHKLLMCIDL